MRRYPILTAIVLGLFVGVIGIVLMAAGDGGRDGAVGSPAVASSVPRTTAVPSTGDAGEPGIGQRGSGGHSCASRTGTRNGESVQLNLCADPTTVAVGEVVRFVASAAPCNATLEFGDGRSAVVSTGPARGDLPYSYAEQGRYTARLTAPDCGTGGEIALSVTVT